MSSLQTSRRGDSVRSQVGPVHVLAAAAILGLLVMPVAFAAEGNPGAARSANPTKQIKKLKQQVAALSARLAAVEARPDQVGQVPSSLPPSGSAGGDLIGAYPNPTIANGAVAGGAGGKVADNTLTDDDLAPSAQFNGAAASGDLTGSYPNPAIASNAVGSAEVFPNSLDASDISEAGLTIQGDVTGTLGNAAIGANTIGTSEVLNDDLTGFDVNESSLVGLADTAGAASCCLVRGGDLDNDTPYSAGNPSTFVDLGLYELRSTAAGETDKIDICNTAVAGVNTIFQYAGGAFASTSSTRTANPISGNTCEVFDFGDAVGDFQLLIPQDQTVVFGFASANLSLIAIGY